MDEPYKVEPAVTDRYIEVLGRGKLLKFSNIRLLNDDLKARTEAIDRGEASTQYLGVTDVPEAAFEGILRKRDSGYMVKSLRFTYDSPSKLLITKIPGSLHEIAHTSLSQEIGFELRSLGVGTDRYAWVGATRFAGGPNSGRSKEADQAFLPSGRSCSNGDYPTFIIEVGVSESMSMLRADAAFWLLNIGGGCRLVLVAAVNRDMRYIAFELYQRGLVPGRITRNNPNPPNRLEAVLAMPQVVIQQAGALGPPSISIPLQVLFDVVPPGVTGNDVVLTAQLLRSIASRIWQIA